MKFAITYGGPDETHYLMERNEWSVAADDAVVFEADDLDGMEDVIERIAKIFRVPDGWFGIEIR